MDIRPHEGSPTTKQIERACRIHSAGGSVRDYYGNSGMTRAAAFLAWCAALAAHEISQRDYIEDR